MVRARRFQLNPEEETVKRISMVGAFGLFFALACTGELSLGDVEETEDAEETEEEEDEAEEDEDEDEEADEEDDEARRPRPRPRPSPRQKPVDGRKQRPR